MFVETQFSGDTLGELVRTACEGVRHIDVKPMTDGAGLSGSCKARQNVSGRSSPLLTASTTAFCWAGR